MKNVNVVNVNEIPVVTPDVMINPAIQVILKGAIATLQTQCNKLNGTDEEDYIPFMSMQLAKDILVSCPTAFNELLHYTICYQENAEIPFLVQRDFFHAYDSVFMKLNEWTRADVIVAQAFDIVEEYVQLVFKVAVLIEVERGNTTVLDDPNESDVLEALPVDLEDIDGVL